MAKNERNPVAPSIPDPVIIDITPGELLDRFSILEIKCDKFVGTEKGYLAGVELDKLRQASEHLQNDLLNNAKLYALFGNLRATNAALWKIEDDIRALDSEVFPIGDQVAHTTLTRKDKQYMELARAVYITNDERSRLKAEINKKFGITPEVKEYHSYGQEEETSPKV